MMNNLNELREFLNILSKKHSIEVLIYCYTKPRTAHEICKYLNVPYTTIKTRLNELISIKAVTIYNRRGKTHSFATENFLLTINPKLLSQMTTQSISI